MIDTSLGLLATRIQVPLASPAAGGEAFEFYVEAAANLSADGERYQIAPRGGTEPIFRDGARFLVGNRAVFRSP